MGSRQYSKRMIQRSYVREKVDRPKSFKTEEAAKAWAEKQGLKDYNLVNLRTPESKAKKIRVIA